jgi:hypothetical protein
MKTTASIIYLMHTKCLYFQSDLKLPENIMREGLDISLIIYTLMLKIARIWRKDVIIFLSKEKRF